MANKDTSHCQSMDFLRSQHERLANDLQLFQILRETFIKTASYENYYVSSCLLLCNQSKHRTYECVVGPGSQVLLINPPNILLPVCCSLLAGRKGSVTVLTSDDYLLSRLNDQFDTEKPSHAATIHTALFGNLTLPQPDSIDVIYAFGCVESRNIVELWRFTKQNGFIVISDKNSVNLYSKKNLYIVMKFSDINIIDYGTKASIKISFEWHFRQNLDPCFTKMSDDRTSLTKVSKPVSKLVSSDETQTAYECPVCLLPLCPPTSLCINGHFICAKCKPTLTKCPVCTGDLTQIKNTIFDKILKQLPAPCKGALEGCTLVLYGQMLRIHEQHCEFIKRRSCPYEDCKAALNDMEYSNHVLQSHSDDCLQKKENFPIEVLLSDIIKDVPINSIGVYLVHEKINNAYFEIKVKQGNEILMAVEFLGAPQRAKQYEAVYTVTNKQGSYSFGKELFHQDSILNQILYAPHLQLDRDDEDSTVTLTIQQKM